MKSFYLLLIFGSSFVCNVAVAQSFTAAPNGDALVEGKDIYCISGATVQVEGGRNNETADIKLTPGSGCSSSYTGKLYLDGTTKVSGSLEVAGNVHALNKVYAKRVEILDPVPRADYVFANDYSLLPINAVESFIKENRHLPNIPSAAQVKGKGYDIGEMDNLLLEKVEELTLYIIQQEKRIKELESKLND